MAETLDRRVFKDLSYGLYIVTSCQGDKLNGQLVNTVIQVTSEPARVAVIINKQNLTHAYISASRVFAAAVLRSDAPLSFFGPFGFRSGRDVDKLAQVRYRTGITGCPLVTEHVLSVLEARVLEQVDLGSHTIFVGDVVASEVLASGEALTYQYYRDTLKGKSPKAAPTYSPPA